MCRVAWQTLTRTAWIASAVFTIHLVYFLHTDTTVSINFTSGFEAKFVIRPDNDETSYNDVVIAGSTLNIAGTPNNFSIPENMPDMTILEFLSGIFKMFNKYSYLPWNLSSAYV